MSPADVLTAYALRYIADQLERGEGVRVRFTASEGSGGFGGAYDVTIEASMLFDAHPAVMAAKAVEALK